MQTDSNIQTVGVDEAQALLRETNTLVLDVRSPGEFETAHIDGAVNIPVDRLDPHLREIVSNAGGTMVLVCQSGGMNAWLQSGAPVRRGDVQRWGLERQVRLVAGSMVLLAVVASVMVPWLKWVGAGVGGGLVFAAITNTCMMGNLLSKLPYNRGPGCDIDQALTRLGSR